MSYLPLDAQRRSRPSVSIVLPALDEEANIARAIAEATAAAERLFEDHEIIVVDDGSRDGTAALARAAADRDPRVRVISHGKNQGYGSALRTGFLACRLDFVFFTDADLQFDVGEIARLLPFAGLVDVVAGYRLNRQDPLHRRLMAGCWNLLVRLLFHIPVRDVNCAFKLFDRRVLQDMEIDSDGYLVNAELMVKLSRGGASVVEVGVHHRPRIAGKAHASSPRGMVKVFAELARMRSRLRELDGDERLAALTRLREPAEAARVRVRARRSGSGGRG
jgi:glycosyltransferase involved in cell wall biosynthesis